MMKKIISTAMAALMMCSVAAIAASADEVAAEPAGASADIQLSGTTGKIRFDMGNWNHEDSLAFYIWAEKEGADTQYCLAGSWGGDENKKWGTKKNLGDAVEGEDGIIESYEFEMPDSSWNVFVIFHDLTTDAQTCDCVITENAFGDTAYMTGDYVENPVDSDKSALDVAFRNAGDCGSHRMVTSTGNISGRVPAPNDNPARQVANYVTKQLGVVDKNGEQCVTEEKVATAISTFGTDADSVWAEIPNSPDYKADQEAEYKKMIKPTSGSTEGNSDNDGNKPADTGDGTNSNTSSTTSSSGGSTTTTTGTKTTTTTGTTTTTTTSGTASAEAGAATGDTTGTAAFAVVLAAAAITMFFARKKVEE